MKGGKARWGDIRKTVTDLQEHLIRYLSKEKKAMEDRIRQVIVYFVREDAGNEWVGRHQENSD